MPWLCRIRHQWKTHFPIYASTACRRCLRCGAHQHSTFKKIAEGRWRWTDWADQ